MKDAEADPVANIESRHHPVKARIIIKLRGIKKAQKSRKTNKTYIEREHTEEEKKEWDEKVEKIIDEKSRGMIGESKWREMNIREKTDNLIGMLKEAALELKEEPRKERNVMFLKKQKKSWRKEQ